MEKAKRSLTDFERGVIIGLLVGEGHFGGDGRQPHILIKMHVRHQPLLEWLGARIPGAKLYGPYNHGGRHYSQLMVRGRPLLDFVLGLIADSRWWEIDPHSHQRLRGMIDRYMAPGG
ncbi:MAG TPA: hypothetical protein PLN89_10865 [Elusimicrobiota bacterium]|jgi:hypothetical protein|nr:hypothetical protein [Elusimicrobiota bacterium]